MRENDENPPSRPTEPTEPHTVHISEDAPESRQREGLEGGARSSRPHGITIDTQALGEAAGSSRPVSNGTGNVLGKTNENASTSIPRTQSPLSPASPRRRGRGLTQLFSNGHDQPAAARASGADGTVHSVTRAHSDGTALELSTIQKRGSLGMSAPNEAISAPANLQPYDGEGSEGSVNAKMPANTVPHGLPHYAEWSKRKRNSLGSRTNGLFEIIKKKVLRINEIPPSKDGRHIPLIHLGKDLLLDERTGRHYVNNTIRSSRYTLWTFFPRQLLAQFSKLANL